MFVKSLLDQDLYKFTVHQIIFHRFNNLSAEYAFTCRNNDKVQLQRYIGLNELRSELTLLGSLKLTDTELEYLRTLGFFTEEYLDYLRCFRLNTAYLTVEATPNGGYSIRTKGPWLSIILFETLVLSTVNGLYARNYAAAHGINPEQLFTAASERLEAKIPQLKHPSTPQIIEFGTRRRSSYEWQAHVISTLKNLVPQNLVGTSNLHFAMLHNLRGIGTFGHELPMGLQGIFPIQHSQREAFKIWLREYRGTWGIALTDTLGDAKFFHDFTFELAKGYDGVRHDSGDPFEFGEAIIQMYQKFGINPLTKRLVFSDGLNIPEVIRLQERFHGRILCSYGIGTNLTNDNGLIPVPQIVMKIVKSHGQPVVKLSNNAGKISCEDTTYAQYAQHMVRQFV